ncbi:MAG: hypothetical protein IJ234_01815 [Clostridia bacterium]|nr:hypothetical protein [Clostridia bacterium]
MSFISSSTGKTFQAGHFLVDDENCTRLTGTVSANHAQVITREDGLKYVPAGAVIPANDGTAVGILYEDTDVTNGDAPCSVVTAGEVYADRLPTAPAGDAITAMTDIAFTAASPAITRPDFGGDE